MVAICKHTPDQMRRLRYQADFVLRVSCIKQNAPSRTVVRDRGETARRTRCGRGEVVEHGFSDVSMLTSHSSHRRRAVYPIAPALSSLSYSRASCNAIACCSSVGSSEPHRIPRRSWYRYAASSDRLSGVGVIEVILALSSCLQAHPSPIRYLPGEHRHL